MADSDKLSEVAAAVMAFARLMVSDPDSVTLNIAECAPHTATLCLSAGKEDLGRLIGNQGRTVTALRVLVRAIAKANGLSLELDIPNKSGEAL